MAKQIVGIIAPPSAGKGTQAQMLVERFGFVRVESSAVLDAEKARDPSSTALTSDSVVIPVVGRYVEKLLDDVDLIFDGFPRSTAQVDFLYELGDVYRAKGMDVQIIIVHLDVPDEVCIAWNKGRWEETPVESRRPDDSPEKYRDRLERSHTYIPAVVRHVNETSPESLRYVPGDGTREQIHNRIVERALKRSPVAQ
jgi:adenylate kinase